ncbi:SDR family oxidoreductase [bacterium]|nr:MAG: SDR family oxidoreductase [bacterium]
MTLLKNNSTNLKNKIAVITGGTGGIGSVIASLFAEESAKVIILDINQKKINALVKEIGRKSIGIKADVRNLAQIKKAVNGITKKFKKIDILINAAGVYGPIGLLVDSDLDNWFNNIKINLLGTVNFCKAVLPLMIKNRGGRIVNFSGGGATFSRPHFSAYAVSKTAVVKFTETLADEVKKYNIYVNSIAPGAINTNMLKEVLQDRKGAGKEEFEKAQERQKTGGTPVELVAELVLFLASEKSHNLTGKLISAPWDNWKKWNKKDINQINKTAKYTLKRIDNKYFKEI